MKLRNRFILIGIGIIIFVLATPVIVFYALGYQYNFKENKIVRTGTLVVHTSPTKAKVFLNDKLASDKTPAVLRFLSPGDYIIRITKPEYQDWTKRLGIYKESVTWANNNRDFVTLFFQNPKSIETIGAKSTLPSQTNNQLIYLTDNEIWSLNSSLNKEKLFNYSLDTLNVPITWTNTSKVQNLIQFSPHLKFIQNNLNSINKIETNGDYTAALIGGILYSYRVETGFGVIAKGVITFSLQDKVVYFLENQTLKRIDLSTNNIETVADIPFAFKSAALLRGPTHTFMSLDERLYYVNNGIEKIYDRANYVYWDYPSGNLIFSNDNEILLFDPNRVATTLVHRSLSQISNPILNAYTGYVFFQNEGKIKAIELDSRDHSNVYTLTDSLESFLVSTDGDNLVVFSETEIKTYRIK